MNRVCLIGRLCSDPELRHTTTGMAVCQVSLAINRSKQKGEIQETDFINVIIWDKQAENIAKYQKKGNQIAIEGKLQTSKYKDKDDKTIYKLEVIAIRVQFLDSIKTESKEEVNVVESINAEDLDLPLPF